MKNRSIINQTAKHAINMGHDFADISNMVTNLNCTYIYIIDL